MADRWATFDCYGTLIDWDGGIRRELERLFGVEGAPRLLERYHELEAKAQAGEYRSYAEVMTLTLMQLAEEESLAIPEGEADSLARSLPGWEPFPEVPPALSELRARGWKLAVLSNSDSALIAASQVRIGVPFDATIVAEDVGSYKPAYGHWQRFRDETGASDSGHVHVAASLFHDIVPASELGLTSVWINRLRQSAGHMPTRELTDLTQLPETLDELVPA